MADANQLPKEDMEIVMNQNLDIIELGFVTEETKAKVGGLADGFQSPSPD
jgi:hypothetical protein